jgi:hypothetical protein
VTSGHVFRHLKLADFVEQTNKDQMQPNQCGKADIENRKYARVVALLFEARNL